MKHYAIEIEGVDGSDCTYWDIMATNEAAARKKARGLWYAETHEPILRVGVL